MGKKILWQATCKRGKANRSVGKLQQKIWNVRGNQT